MSQNRDFTQGSILKALANVATPIMLISILQVCYQLADAFWVGRLGAHAVAAISITFPITFLVIALGASFAVAGATLVSQHAGAKNQDMVNHISTQSIIIVVFVSVILSCIGFISAPTILKFFRLEDAIYNSALSYIQISFCGMFFIFIYAMFQALMRGVGEVKLPFKIALFSVVLNFVLDPLLIFGTDFFSGLGIRGAAISTLATQASAALLGIYFLVLGKNGIHISVKSAYWDKKYYKKAFLLGLPTSIELSMRSFLFIIITFFVSAYGTASIAAYGIGLNILQLVNVIGMSLSMAISSIVGQNLGSNNTARAEHAAIIACVVGFSILSILSILANIYSENLIKIFLPRESSATEIGSQFIDVSSLGWCFIPIQLCLLATFRAAGKTVLSMMITLCGQWLIQIPIILILSYGANLGIVGVWWSFPVSTILTAVIAVSFFIKGGWKNGDMLKFYSLKKEISKE